MNVVVSTNKLSYALHEACLGAIKESKEAVDGSQECALQVGICSMSSRLDYPRLVVGEFLVMRLRSMDSNLMATLGVG